MYKIIILAYILVFFLFATGRTESYLFRIGPIDSSMVLIDTVTGKEAIDSLAERDSNSITKDLSTGDLNANGQTSVSDIITLVNKVFRDGTIPSPFISQFSIRPDSNGKIIIYYILADTVTNNP